MKVIVSKKAYALYCMKQICLSPSLPDYIKRSKGVRKILTANSRPFNIYMYAIRYFETYELPFKLSVDWNLRERYYDFDSI